MIIEKIDVSRVRLRSVITMMEVIQRLNPYLKTKRGKVYVICEVSPKGEALKENPYSPYTPMPLRS